MPIVPKTNRPMQIKRGSLTALAKVDGHSVGLALSEALVNFRKEHGRDPDMDRTSFFGGFTTFETVFELVEDYDDGPELRF